MIDSIKANPLKALVIVTCAGLIATVVCSTLASWAHLSLAFGSIEAGQPWHPPTTLVPVLSATSVELGLISHTVALALLTFLGGRKRWPVIGIVLFCLVSFGANVHSAYDAVFTAADAGVLGAYATANLLTIQGLSIVALGGSLPVLIIVASETLIAVVSGYRLHLIAEAPETGDGGDGRRQDATQTAPAVGFHLNGSAPTPQPAMAVGQAEGRTIQSAPRVPTHRTKVGTDPVSQIVAHVARSGPAHHTAVSKATGLAKPTIYKAVARDSRLVVDRGFVALAPAV